MVTISNFKQRTNKEGKEFISLELQGDVELIQSLKSGKFYASARRAFITSTFNSEFAKGLIGTKLPGTIKRVESDPYEYTIPESGELITLAYRYEYQPENMQEVIPHSSLTKRDFMLRKQLA